MRILIAEDDQVLADGLLRTLRSSGAVVTMWPAAARPIPRC
jgi:two-component system OmpR family response regulator